MKMPACTSDFSASTHMVITGKMFTNICSKQSNLSHPSFFSKGMNLWITFIQIYFMIFMHNQSKNDQSI